MILPVRPGLEYEEPMTEETRREVAKYEQGMNNMLGYMERNFTGFQAGDGTWRKPAYTHDLWNKHEDVKDCDQITTNKSEVSLLSFCWFCFIIKN